jgi:hypothetical protein
MIPKATTPSGELGTPSDNGGSSDNWGEKSGRVSRRKDHKKKPKEASKNDLELQHFGQVLLPRITEYWQMLHRVPAEVMDPIYSKVSPLNKNHFNVQVYWYLISSICFPKMTRAAAVPKSSSRFQHPKKTDCFYAFLAKTKKGESLESMKKKVFEALSEEKAKGSLKASLAKKNKQLKLAEVMGGYLELKRGLLELPRPTLSQSNEEPAVKTHGFEIETASTELETKEIARITDTRFCVGGSIWRQLSRARIDDLLKAISETQTNVRSRREELLRESERRRVLREQTISQTQGPTKKGSKKDPTTLFASTVKESDVLFHLKNQVRMEKKYLKLLDQQTRAPQHEHHPEGENVISNLNRGPHPCTRKVL